MPDGTRYRQRNYDGAFEVSSTLHERQLRQGDCFPAALNPIPRKDPRACACGKRMWVRPPDGPRRCLCCGRDEGSD